MDKDKHSDMDYVVGDKVNFIFAGFERSGEIEDIEKLGQIDRITKTLYSIRAFDTNNIYPVYKDQILNKI